MRDRDGFPSRSRASAHRPRWRRCILAPPSLDCREPGAPGARELRGAAEIGVERLGGAKVQKAVGLGWKAGPRGGGAFRGETPLDDIADETPPHLRYRRSSCRHAAAIPLSM